MKVRQGFVSNSSSSSFVVVGYAIKTEELEKISEDKDIDIYDEIYDSGFRYLCSGDNDTPEGCDIIGKDIASMDEYFMKKGEISLEDLSKKATKVKDKLKELGIDIKDIKAKIYTGTRAC